MKNKYYTPSIEEFHYGFEYEYKKASCWGYLEQVKEWTKETFTGGSTQDEGSELDWVDTAISEVNKDNMIRVKCLDKEDIISLGWELQREHTDNDLTCYSFRNDVFQLSNSYSYYSDTDKKEDIKESWIIQSYTPNFTGTIKNKSELRKVMQMVGINN